MKQVKLKAAALFWGGSCGGAVSQYSEPMCDRACSSGSYSDTSCASVNKYNTKSKSVTIEFDSSVCLWLFALSWLFLVLLPALDPFFPFSWFFLNSIAIFHSFASFLHSLFSKTFTLSLFSVLIILLSRDSFFLYSFALHPFFLILSPFIFSPNYAHSWFILYLALSWFFPSFFRSFTLSWFFLSFFCSLTVLWFFPSLICSFSESFLHFLDYVSFFLYSTLSLFFIYLDSFFWFLFCLFFGLSFMLFWCSFCSFIL